MWELDPPRAASPGADYKCCTRLPPRPRTLPLAPRRWHSHVPVRARRIRSLPACAERRTERRRKYVVTFYPRWFSYVQAGLAGIAGGNQPAGPHRMIPVFGCVVAPAGDTLYAAAFFDLSREPISLAIPPIDISYPVLAVDA